MSGENVVAEPRWERLGEADEYLLLCRTRIENVVPVREPLVLVSQVERSGGTLLSQLFDGHPECHAHPHELWIGHPTSRDWPPLDLASPERWFELLFERKAAMHFREGYRKSRLARAREGDVFPFCFLPRLQHAIFEACTEAWPVESERDVLDCYMTSYFNAWLDNQNLFARRKKVVTGFVPRLAMQGGNLDRFFAAYPDGTLVTIVRDPRSWYGSMRRHREKFHDVDLALGLWRRSTDAAIDAVARFGERVIVLTYEDLVRQTEATMSRVAGRLGLTMSAGLTEPTFNGRPIRANSGLKIREFGIVQERTTAYRDELEAETISRVEELAGDLYVRAQALSSFPADIEEGS